MESRNNDALKLIAKSVELLKKYIDENDIDNDAYIEDSINHLNEAIDKLAV